MSLQIRDLSVLAYANGFTLWHYNARAARPQAAEERGFFAAAADMLTAGDMIVVTGTKGGRLLCLTQEESGLRATALS